MARRKAKAAPTCALCGRKYDPAYSDAPHCRDCATAVKAAGVQLNKGNAAPYLLVRILEALAGK